MTNAGYSICVAKKPTRAHRFIASGGILGLFIFAGCAPAPRAAKEARAPTKPGVPELQHRAEQLWSARIENRWSDVFRIQDPNAIESGREAEFVNWAKENEPFEIQSFQIKTTQVANDLGWVEVDYRSTLRRFPDLPPRDATCWEKWRISKALWWPVPRTELDLFPDAPATRNATEEGRLYARFAEAWRAIQARDRLSMRQLVDPRVRDRTLEGTLLAASESAEYVRCESQWIEVVGDSGRIRVRYQVKSTDPSLTKLPPQDHWITERWVRVDGEWYRSPEASAQ